MYRLQFHHAMAERANDAPAAGSCSYRHRHGAKTDYPFRQRENWRLKKIQPARQMIEASGFRAGKQRESDNAHCFLRIIRTVTVRHPGRAEDLQFAKERMDKVRRETVQHHKKQKHQEPAKNKSGKWRGDHWHNDFWPHSSIPFYHRPIAVSGSKRCAAEAADEGVTRTGGQTEPPRGDVPRKRGDHCAKYRRHRDDIGVHESFADSGSNRATKQCAGEIEKRCHGNSLSRCQDPRGNDGGDRVRGVVKAVAVFENDRRENDGNESQHAFNLLIMSF